MDNPYFLKLFMWFRFANSHEWYLVCSMNPTAHINLHSMYNRPTMTIINQYGRHMTFPMDSDIVIMPRIRVK